MAKNAYADLTMPELEAKLKDLKGELFNLRKKSYDFFGHLFYFIQDKIKLGE